MNRSILISVLLLGLGLAGCDKPPTVVNVPAAAPGPAGPQGATGEQGSKGDTGKAAPTAAPTAPPEAAK